MELMKTFIPYVITIINGKMNISSIGDNHNDGVSQSDALYSNKEDETEFNYDPNGEKGPAERGRIHPEWGSCSHGSMQSPIDLMNDGVDKPSNSSLRNRGHDMMLKWEGGAGIIEINGSGYMDSSSAAGIHLLNIQSMAKERHTWLMQASIGKVAVVGIMYMIGGPDSFLSSDSYNRFPAPMNKIQRRVQMIQAYIIIAT
ncbi:hypothetical protein NC653_022408 [Populus alba x Populus x berolinensis]|uniref:Uncharacterized protein n=1 Tax=Populus alba x Populus x berolinensis TaxID=444605 RepID=A0AAD6MH17_9ROSI|nr:hypothetical protein NC653_022408 [Populus alba x Populus x berolinensis]